MSVLVKDCKMPKSCADCFLEDTYEGYNCRIAQKSANWGLGERPSWCPLVEVPTPHGRLIDADALGDFPYNMDFCDGWEADVWVQNAPTIIEAEEGEA